MYPPKAYAPRTVWRRAPARGSAPVRKTARCDPSSQEIVRRAPSERSEHSTRRGRVTPRRNHAIYKFGRHPLPPHCAKPSVMQLTVRLRPLAQKDIMSPAQVSIRFLGKHSLPNPQKDREPPPSVGSVTQVLPASRSAQRTRQLGPVPMQRTRIFGASEKAVTVQSFPRHLRSSVLTRPSSGRTSGKIPGRI